LFGSLFGRTSVCVCEPRQVWTAAICCGAEMLEMSNTRMQRNSVFVVSDEQSTRPALVDSTDTKSRFL
jgi:hypothetical protein